MAQINRRERINIQQLCKQEIWFVSNLETFGLFLGKENMFDLEKLRGLIKNVKCSVNMVRDDFYVKANIYIFTNNPIRLEHGQRRLVVAADFNTNYCDTTINVKY